MKRLFFLGFLASILFVSCSKDDDNNNNESTPLKADFTVTVTGESPNAKVAIVNNSTGATTYSWTFGEGADISSSSDKTPAIITVDKSGDFSIKLVVKNSTSEKELSKNITINGNNAIVEYKDIEFGLNAGDDTYGRLFSFETGLIYKDNEITNDNGSKIHLAFGSMSNTMYYFESPTVKDYNIPNATETKVINYESEPTISVATFDEMTDDRELSGLTIEGTNDSFGNSSIPGTVLFEISTGRKGVIKTKSVDDKKLVVDIKIQKY